jgi:hypothetical protein
MCSVRRDRRFRPERGILNVLFLIYVFRNLGVAEFEYLRLFEQERLSSNNAANLDAFDTSLTRSSSADIPTNVKVEQMLEQFGILDPQVFQPAALLNSQDNQTFEAGSPSDSDSNTTTNPSLIDNPPQLSKSPSSFGPLSNQIDPRQLMFALSQFNQELRNASVLNSLTNNQLGANFIKAAGIDSSPTAESNEKEKQNQTSPTIKRQLEDNENMMRMFSVKKRKINGIFGNPNLNLDEKWRRQMLEVILICKVARKNS